MRYTELSPQIELELTRIAKEKKMFEAIQKPSSFMFTELGILPFKVQHYILRKFADDSIEKNDRLIICKSRQIGISICLAVLSIWYAAFNKANGGKGTGIHHNTKVGIISKSDNQSKKLMKEIQGMVFRGSSFLQDMVLLDKRVPLNKNEIYFKGGFIKCFPPTDASRGETFDLVIGDEAAFIEEDIFKDVIEPTVSAVGGKIILSSTPNGQKGFFYELFDPNELADTHEYERIWFWWKMVENPVQLRIIEQKKDFAIQTGNLKSFDQEYNALFTVDKSSFFENNDIDKNINHDLSEEIESNLPVCIAIDYGMLIAETCITVVAEEKSGLRLIFQFSQTHLDDNLLMDSAWEHSFPNLKKRYPNIQHIIADKCAQGYRTNQQLINEGYPIIEFDFRSDRMTGERNRGYYKLRAALKKEQIKYPFIRELIDQLKIIQEERLQMSTRIKGPDKHLDDRADSLMMAVYPFLTEDLSISSFVVDYSKILNESKKKNSNPRVDSQWEKIKLRGAT